MPFLHPLRIARSTAVRNIAPRVRGPLQARYAGDYGGGEGDPVGENPQKQGKNPREDLEHPGPPAPKVGQNKSTTPNEGSSGSSSASSSSSGTPKSGASSAGQSGGQSASNDGGRKGGAKGAQPKILNENPPSGGEESQDVKKHNEEMETRAEKAHEQVSNKDADRDKVNPKYWSGQGGADREP